MGIELFFVRGNDAQLALRQKTYLFQNDFGGSRVKIGGGLVEQRHRPGVQHHACQGKQLFFATRKLLAVVTQFGLPALLLFGQEFIQKVGVARRRFRCPVEKNIVVETAVEEEGKLVHVRSVFPEPAGRPPMVFFVDRKLAFLSLQTAREQLEQGRFARTRDALISTSPLAGSCRLMLCRTLSRESG